MSVGWILLKRVASHIAVRYNLKLCSSRGLHLHSINTIMPSCGTYLCFDDYDIIGFDLDFTLLQYNINEMVPLVYESLRQFLVEKKHYSRELLKKQLEKGFLQKGLVFDAERGNILKLGADATILRATHGTSLLTSDQIAGIYGTDKKWSISTQFIKDPLSTWNAPLSQKMRTLLDYFDSPASLVFAQAVDVLDEEAVLRDHTKPETYRVWPDVQAGLIEIYKRENFSNGRSAFFTTLQAHPEKYLLKTDVCVTKWLKELRAAGKSLFLLTGSNIDFANFTATFSLGNHWQDLFDSVICFAKKPGYFVNNHPYLEVNGLSEIPNSELDLSSNLKMPCVYSQGNWEQLLKALSSKIKKPASEIRVLYVGDNLIQDIYTPVKFRKLDTVAVCAEVLHENIWKIETDKYKYTEIVSPFWGSYFSIDSKPTLWADIISNYSKLCIPLIECIANKPITHKFFKNATGR